VGTDLAVEMMAAAFDGGINLFDNAKGYAGGRSEEIMGHNRDLRPLWPKPTPSPWASSSSRVVLQEPARSVKLTT
jgi:hypothetical protein